MPAISQRGLRFVINGLFATSVNYVVLTALIGLLGSGFTGIAAFVAALVGIATSFAGSRRFVFRSNGPVLPELLRFKTLYLAIAVLQALFMAAWSDFLGFDYTIGFVLITAISVLLSYVGNRAFVFR